MIIGVVAFLSVLILVSYLYTTGEVKAEEPSISGYIDISQTEFLEKNMSARQSSVIEKNCHLERSNMVCPCKIGNIVWIEC